MEKKLNNDFETSLKEDVFVKEDFTHKTLPITGTLPDLNEYANF
jgi:hypothetical protein